jgi:23S rRNA (guanosine2251-2'-O)-methyltransferase
VLNQIRQCLRPECRFRYPVETDRNNERCPHCGSPTRLVISPYPGMRVPDLETDQLKMDALLDNLRSAYNVGSMFRTADGVGIRHMYLCGMTPTPGQPGIGKTALGAEFAVGWSQHWSSIEAADLLKKEGRQLWALEGGARCEPLAGALKYLPENGIVIVVGNEVSGVDPGLLERCDHVVGLPMLGVKESLNAAVAFGIAAYLIRLVRDIEMKL